MRKILIILFILITQLSFSQVKHYVKNGGNDAASGLSDALAWETITQVNTHAFIPGDTIAFKCGDIWRLIDDPGGSFDINEVGTSGNNIVFTSYDAGDKPRFLGSKTTTWTSEGSNIYHSDETFNAFNATGRIWFELLDGSVVWGVLETSVANLNAEYEYFYDVDSRVHVYATTDPDIRYTSVEVPQVSNALKMLCRNSGTEYITFDNLEVAYFMDCGIRSDWPGGQEGVTDPLRGVEVRNCHIHHSGIKNGDAYGLQLYFSDMIIENNEIDNNGRRNISFAPDGSYYSNALGNIIIRHNILYSAGHSTGVDVINLHTSLIIRDITIENNLFYEGRDVPADALSNMTYLSIQGGAGHIRNIVIANNIYLYTRGSCIVFDGGSEDVDSIYIYNNTFYGTNVNTPQYNPLLYCYSNDDNYVVMKNNIFYMTKILNVIMAVGIKTNWDVDYNLYYTNLGNVGMWSANGGSWTLSQWVSYQSGSGFDAHSPTPADPLFINITYPVEADSLMIDALSPAKDAGIGVGINTDFRDSLRDASPDIGAFEYNPPDYDPPPTMPEVNTGTPVVIYTRLARCSGNMIDDGGDATATRGFCWSTSANPTIADSHTHNGTGEGTFSDYIPNLTAGTTYHIRSWATNTETTTYGPDETITMPVHSVGKIGGKILKYNNKVVILH